MTILVSGGAGYIGSHVVQQLLLAGEKVVVFDNLSTGFKEAVPAGVELVVGDLSDPAALKSLFATHDIEAVMHFAASIVVPESVADPLKYFSNNTANTLNLLRAIRDAKVGMMVFSSTAAVYGMPDVEMVDESLPLAPISPYGSSKLMSEMMLQATSAAHGLRYVALRYFNVAGASLDASNGQRSPNATHLIKIATQAATGQRENMSIMGTDYPTPDGTCLRDYIHVVDLARAHVAALLYLRKGGETVICNCGYGRGSSVREVIAAVKKASGVDFTVIEGPRRAGDPPRLVADNRRLLATLNWKPEHDSLDEIVTTALNWERKLAAS